MNSGNMNKILICHARIYSLRLFGAVIEDEHGSVKVWYCVWLCQSFEGWDWEQSNN